ncbi:MAG: hypothetical protein R6X06_01400 [Gammaproteobacteria bacterium]
MLAELLKQPTFQAEYARHERARYENQPLLEHRLEEIRSGKALDALEPFAKAYLGMFYDIDSNIPPAARLYLLVDEALVAPIVSGLVAAVMQHHFATPAQIALALSHDEQLGDGYIALAGVELFLHQGGDLQALPAETLKAIICFHYANSTYHQDDWLVPLLQTCYSEAAEAFVSFWRVLRQHQFSYLPGMQAILDNDALWELRQRVIVPGAALMCDTRPKELARMLLAALKSGAEADLYDAACEVVEEAESVGIRQQVYWQATAFLLQPQRQAPLLANFVGQEKIKLLPLLDFCYWVLSDDTDRLSGEAIGELIRMIAPKLTPQTDNYGNLSDVTQKVAWLFYLLATRTTLPATQVTKKLRRVRVLKLYSEVMDAVDDLQQKLATGVIAVAPSAERFIQALQSDGKLKSKKNWSDNNF